MTSKRSPYDFYATPKAAVDAMLDQFDFSRINTMCEPFAGDGAIAKAFRERYPEARMWMNEIDTSHADTLTNMAGGVRNTFTWQDFLEISKVQLDGVELFISNPPFSTAQELLEHLFEGRSWTTQGIIMLLRLGFLGSQKRYVFWQQYPPAKVLPLSKRPSFTGHGTDSQEYAWFCWGCVPLRCAKHKTTIQVI